ncbi:unnamed protein product [Cladocopium goreaui]|uniref:Uncharacterized protein n=1 Tax=Cladocopium goreaui TaxID=2562237 RepID=A0A9P1CJK0_9DINO|nr:unnamed protein product [Cladocopium goreaui]
MQNDKFEIYHAQDEKFAALEGLLMEEKRPSKSKDKGATDKSKLESRFDSKDSSKKRIRTMPSLTRASVSQTTPGVDEFDEPLPLYVADLALYHQIALMQRTFPVRLSRWGESMQQAQALPAAWGLVHVFFFFPRNWVFIIKSIVFQCVFFCIKIRES